MNLLVLCRRTAQGKWVYVPDETVGNEARADDLEGIAVRLLADALENGVDRRVYQDWKVVAYPDDEDFGVIEITHTHPDMAEALQNAKDNLALYAAAYSAAARRE